MKQFAWSLTVVLCLVCNALGQRSVDPRNLHERLLCVVPMTGAGTWADPKRPLYAPSPAQMSPTSRTGIIGYTHVLSDDGQSALVEFVARDPSAFDHILADKRITTFRKGKDKREDIEAEFRKHKKDFSFDHFGMRLQ